MKGSFQSALIITLFTIGTQFILFVIQVITASVFGASANLDAFLAASTLPQYIVTIIMGSLGFVLIPVFIDYTSKGLQQNAYRLAVNVFNNCIVVLLVITILGIVFAKPLLQLSAPGLSQQALEIGAKISIITWPSVLVTGAFSLLSSIYQAENRFKWQAAVTFIGAITNVILLLLLQQYLGIFALAIASTLGFILQCILVLKIIVKHKEYNFSLRWGSEFKKVVKLVSPLVLVAILTKFTPLVERHLASQLGEGNIAYLNYSFKVASVITLLISVGGSTVIFSKMSFNVSNGDLNALRNTLSLGLRLILFIVGPVMAVGFFLSLPIVIMLFQRGQFLYSDATVVAEVLQIYLMAVIGMSMGSITSKVFYALKDTKTLAILGCVEAVVYVGYATYLTRLFGTHGLAISYAVYFNLSLLLQLFILKYKIGGKGIRLLKSIAKITVASILSGAVAYFTKEHILSVFLQVIISSTIGVITYLLVMYVLNSSELMFITNGINKIWQGNELEK